MLSPRDRAARAEAALIHVGLNCVFLVPGETGGMEVYARELARALVAGGAVRITAFVNREAAGHDDVLPAAVERVTVPVNATSRVQWVRGEQQLLPRLARAAGVDVVHSLASTAPARGKFRRVVTIHDLHYKVVPEAHFGLRGLGMRVLVPLAARRSHRIIVPSAATRDDLHRELHVPLGKVDVVHEGFGQGRRHLPLPAEEVRARFGLPHERRLLLTLSAKRPHKNLAGLLRALAELPADKRPVTVLPGYPTPYEEELRELAVALGVEHEVRFVGWTSEEELEGLFALADAFVFPSFYEGFGLPVLEAMVRGVPTACSDRASLPEVAGDAALLFDPSNPASIARAITQLLEDDATRERLSRAGTERAASFTWERAATATLAAYERALRAA